MIWRATETRRPGSGPKRDAAENEREKEVIRMGRRDGRRAPSRAASTRPVCLARIRLFCKFDDENCVFFGGETDEHDEAQFAK